MATQKITVDGRHWVIPLPDKCPVCHKLVIIKGGMAHANYENNLDVAFICPNPDCKRIFISTYDWSSKNGPQIVRQYPVLPTETEIPDNVKKISPIFVEIYQQSNDAKNQGLDHICGPGFRKALEFLLKDYAKSVEAKEENKKLIEKKFLGAVISDHVNDPRIKNVAKRGAWLGNDETHYVRRWQDKDVTDLILLIKLSIHWIEMERLTKHFKDDMPD